MTYQAHRKIQSALPGSFAVVILLVLFVACGPADAPRVTTDIPSGDRERGRVMFAEYGCSSCHSIPGVTGARGLVGPPLDAWADRGYIAGRLPNTPENLIRWIMSPQEVDPGNAMPDMGVPEVVARDMAAYLYGLHSD
ncbi:MAG: cytochrome C [Dehalococcoidia bacterium]